MNIYDNHVYNIYVHKKCSVTFFSTYMYMYVNIEHRKGMCNAFYSQGLQLQNRCAKVQKSESNNFIGVIVLSIGWVFVSLIWHMIVVCASIYVVCTPGQLNA